MDMAVFAEAKEPFLPSFLTLANGLPSHDTFSRLFRNLDPDQFRDSFQRFMALFSESLQGVVAIDGKTLCGTRETGTKKLVHMVSAWAEGNGLVLGQRKVDEKSNQITAIPKLLNALELAGAVVTIDPVGCQKSIASQIVEQMADSVLAVKEISPPCWQTSRTRLKCSPPITLMKRSTTAMDAWDVAPARCSGI
jgi:hypothetical protein